MSNEYVVKPTSPDVEGAGNIALVLEMIFGWFGLLGIGHAFSGRIALGVGALIAWWFFMSFAVLISTVTLGITLCIFTPIYIAVPIVSGIQARSYIRRMDETGNWGAVAGVAGGGCLVLIVVSAALFFLGMFASILGAVAG